MKKLIIALVTLFTVTVSANAMSYDQARQQALFLTDKMAYELNLNDAQYEAAYEINLDYLMTINHYDDLFGIYWERRNLDLSYIMLDWQYEMFRRANYFYRPLYWDGGYWHFRIYARYPQRNYYYFGAPTFVTVYRGGHSWHRNGNRSWYHGRNYVAHTRNNYVGMRDHYDRGAYRGKSGNVSFGNGPRRSVRNYDNRTFGNNRPNNADSRYNQSGSSSSGNVNFGNRRSSTRTTVTMPNTGSNNSSTRFGTGRRQDQSTTRATVPNRTFTPTPSNGSRSSSFGNRSSSRVTSPSSSSSNRSYRTPSSSFGSSSRSSNSSFGTRSNAGSTNRSNASSNNGSRFGGRR